MLDGLTYVTEMREGDEYRAAEMEYRSDADSTALARVDRVLRAVAKLVQRKDELLRGLTAGTVLIHNPVLVSKHFARR